MLVCTVYSATELGNRTYSLRSQQLRYLSNQAKSNFGWQASQESLIVSPNTLIEMSNVLRKWQSQLSQETEYHRQRRSRFQRSTKGRRTRRFRTPGTRLSNPTRKAAMAAFLFRSDSQVLAFGQLSSGFQFLARTSAITRHARIKPERPKTADRVLGAHGFDRPRFLARCTLRQSRVVLANVFRFRPDRSSRPQTI